MPGFPSSEQITLAKASQNCLQHRISDIWIAREDTPALPQARSWICVAQLSTHWGAPLQNYRKMNLLNFTPWQLNTLAYLKNGNLGVFSALYSNMKSLYASLGKKESLLLSNIKDFSILTHKLLCMFTLPKQFYLFFPLLSSAQAQTLQLLEKWNGGIIQTQIDITNLG